jgi:oxaloacetate decarboxylase gamma subunit
MMDALTGGGPGLDRQKGCIVQGDMISQGIELMLYGMGTVVVFLSLLVAATAAMSRLFTRYFPESQVLLQAAPQLQPGEAGPVDDPELVAVVTAAVHRYRAR